MADQDQTAKKPPSTADFADRLEKGINRRGGLNERYETAPAPPKKPSPPPPGDAKKQ